MFNEEKILKTGICRYGKKEYSVYVIKSDVFYGTGDYEDKLTGEDTEKLCFSVWYEDILHPGRLNSGGGYFETLDEAVKSAENGSGFIGWK